MPRLLVLAPLRLEQLVLGPNGRRGPAALAVERTGWASPRRAPGGPRLSGDRQPAAVAVAGLGGALSDNLVPGDLVVAERLLDATGQEVVALPQPHCSPPIYAGRACGPGRARW